MLKNQLSLTICQENAATNTTSNIQDGDCTEHANSNIMASGYNPHIDAQTSTNVNETGGASPDDANYDVTSTSINSEGSAIQHDDNKAMKALERMFAQTNRLLEHQFKQWQDEDDQKFKVKQFKC